MDIEYLEDIEFYKISHIRLGLGMTTVAYPKKQEELIALIKLAVLSGVRYYIVGGFTNILPPDEDFHGIVIQTKYLNGISVDNSYIEAECGVVLSKLINFSYKIGFYGMEGLFGIPGSLGGAIYSNSGAFGFSVSDHLMECRVYDPVSDEVVCLNKDQLCFSYRQSIFKNKSLALLSAKFSFPSDCTEHSNNGLREYILRRKKTQPFSERTLGSVFLKHEGVSAAYYIEKSGLKGFENGNATVSDKHAGFIVSHGIGASADYKKLIAKIKNKVYSDFGIQLREEIVYLN